MLDVSITLILVGEKHENSVIKLIHKEECAVSGITMVRMGSRPVFNISLTCTQERVNPRHHPLTLSSHKIVTPIVQGRKMGVTIYTSNVT